MAQPALDTFRSLDHTLAAAVATAAPSVVHVARGRTGGTGIVWAADLVISASFHTPDQTKIGIFIRLMPGARMNMIVTRKLRPPRMDDSPKVMMAIVKKTWP